MSLIFPDEILLKDAGMRGGSRIFRLEHYFRVNTSFGKVTVPTGFETDGASVPQVFWSVFPPLGKYFPAAVLHDYLYSRQSTLHFECDREEADFLFLEAMFNLGVPWHTRHTIHMAVRMFGGKSYKK
jgi:hypothetical protein